MAQSQGYYDAFPLPLADPADTGEPPRPAEVPDVVTRRLAALRAAGHRRLAVVDTHLPWQLSGFRYHEFSEMARQRPDTVFFSLFGMAEEFPSTVYKLADFPRLAPRLGVTDVYFVFLNFALGLLGMTRAPGAETVTGLRHDLSVDPTFRAHDMRLHATLYPGGGLLPDTPPDLLRALSDRLATVFTNVDEVRDVLPQAHFGARIVATRLYSPVNRPERDELRLVFAADDRPRKGLATLIEAFNSLGEGFHLDLVGPHRRHLDSFTNPRFTAHGWASPQELREIYQGADAFVSPVTRDTFGGEGSEPGTVDGFPTSTAIDAMSTGALLVSSNPRGDRTVVLPGEHYVEIPERDPNALAETLRTLRADPEWRRRVADAGMRRIHEEMSVERGVAEKLAAMGL
jgi:glycosyltransferase involved in cell wall biosynthesis